MPQPQSPAVLVTRTILWIVLASLFLLRNVNLVRTAHLAGRTPSAWVFAQLTLWAVALVFWLYTGWRDWTRRPPDPTSRR
jgi:membrane protein YdbS with pleckstrin-like domain